MRRVTDQPKTLHLACLCAAWCRLCDDYASVLARVLAEPTLRDIAIRPHWIDIEDEAELVGDIDVETFPTLVLIGPQGLVRFAGPVAPHADTLRRLLLAAAAQTAAASPLSTVSPELQAFARRLGERLAR